ncbi:MAG: heavy-metal-associated domain-containing protein [Clostridiales bacterium]|jgi:cation transport ATPase|nr:heavy-metal-associated domain-containing protein [Clostridiales bacterium]
MTKIFRVENLDCANCAAKMEKKIAAIDGVEACSLNFMTGRMSINASESSMDEIVKLAEKAVKKIEPDAKLTAR